MPKPSTSSQKNTKTENDSLDNQSKISDFFQIKSKKKEKHSSNEKQLKVENDEDSNNKRNEDLSGSLKGEDDPEKQLLYFFKDKKIYIEIINDGVNSSSIFYDLLLKYKIIKCKNLSKKIDYIIFKDGHLKTKIHAILNNIKLVNPLWIDDKVKHHIFKDDKEYEIKTNLGDIMLKEECAKNKKGENINIDEENLYKDYDHELEIEYDTPYANYIDKLRENDSQNINDNEMSTIEKSINPKHAKINSLKDNTINNIFSDIQREKRKSPKTNNKDNLIIINKEENNDILKGNNSLNNKNNENKSTKNNKSRNNKKNQRKAKNSKSVAHNNTKLLNNSQKTSNKNKNDNNEKNYILELNQNNSKVLSLAKNSEIKSTSEKISIMTYKLEADEIQSLKSLNNFEYKGNINNNEKNKKKNINANIIILEKNKVIYDWKMYEFLLDKKIVVDFASFLFEFINDEKHNTDILEIINQISINNEIIFFNKRMRMQKRSMMQSLKIVDNIIPKEKNEKINQQNDVEKKYFFMINEDIDENEKKVLQKLLKNYLKADIINTNKNKRSKSSANQINITLEKMAKKNNLETIKENDNKEVNDEEADIKKDSNEIGKSKNINIHRINNIMLSNKNNDTESNDLKENINEKQKIEGTFLISKEKINNKRFFKKIKDYKGIISYEYIYDSFLNGQLLDLNDKEILEKYKLQ